MVTHATAPCPPVPATRAPAPEQAVPDGHAGTVPPPVSPLLTRRRMRHRALAAVTGAVGLLVAAVVGFDLWLLGSPGETGPSAEQISQALADTAASQEAFHEQHGRYTSDQGDLVQVGWLPATGVDVSIVAAGRSAFCLAAGPAGADPVAWLTEDWVPLTEACD